MKFFKVFAAIAMISLFMVGCSDELQTPDMDQDVLMELKKGNDKNGANTIDFNGAHFELNLLGKKDDWNGKDVDNMSRHTMFIPRNTANWTIITKKPNNIGDADLPGVRIDMTQGEEFAVIDGTVFDGDGCEFQLGPGKYAVYVASRGKKGVSEAQIAAWLEALQTTLDLETGDTDDLWIYQKLGEINVKRSWSNMTSLFTITEAEAGGLPWPDGMGDVIWIFDYMEWLGAQEIIVDGEKTTYSQLAYFWQLQNSGSQLIKVRFYPID